MQGLVPRQLHFFLTVVLCALPGCLYGNPAAAQTVAAAVPIAVNTPQVFSAPVTVGQAIVEIPLPLAGIDSFQLQIVAPLNGAMIELLDPSGKSVLQPADPLITFLDGASLSPPLP